MIADPSFSLLSIENIAAYVMDSFRSERAGMKTSSATSSTSSVCLDGVSDLDVICGRDKQAQSHAGNKRFRQIIQSYHGRYKNATKRREKTAITGEIISQIESSGGRFLKYNEEICQWEEVDAASTHEKVSHALRSAREPNRFPAKKRRSPVEQQPTVEEEKAFESLRGSQEAYFSSLMHDDSITFGHIPHEPIEAPPMDLEGSGQPSSEDSSSPPGPH